MTWDDGSTVQYFNFVDWTEPFGDDSGCYKIAPPGYGVPSNSWHDHDCRDNLGYICETEGKRKGTILALFIFFKMIGIFIQYYLFCIYRMHIP